MEKYKIINLYTFKEDELIKLWQDKTQKIIKNDDKVSTQRAGEIAAGEIMKKYNEEAEKLEDEIEYYKCDDIPEELVNLYDNYIEKLEQNTIQELLIKLSESRTLFEDSLY